MSNLFSGITNFLSGNQMTDALNKLSNSSNYITNITAPDLSKLIPQLQYQVQQGTLTPAQAQAQLQQASLYSGVNSDASTVQGARTGLNQLNEIASNGGQTQADRAQIAADAAQVAAKTASDRQAQIQQLQQQGNAGTGAELAARLSGVQGEANANANAGAQVATAEQQRALQAIQSGIQGNTALNSQLFDQAAKKAQAQDAINQFNTNAQNQFASQNAQNQQASNVANFNTANQIAGINTGIANQQAAMPYNAAQANFTNQLNQGVAASTADRSAGATLAGLAGQQAVSSQNAITGLFNSTAGQAALSGLGGLVTNAAGQLGKWVSGAWQAATPAQTAAAQATGTYSPAADSQAAYDALNAANTASSATTAANAATDASNASGVANSLSGGSSTDYLSTLGDLLSDERFKKDKKKLSDHDVDELMAHMTAYKYRYKGDKSNPEVNGVMAQDMAKGGMASVVNTDAGKVIQKPEALSDALAILANQHERIKKLEGCK